MLKKRMNLRKGDQVEVLSGKEGHQKDQSGGKRGKILKIDKKHERAVVEKLNFQKRHVRPGHPIAPQGGIIEREGPIPLSKLMLVCPKCQERTRPKFLTLESGARVRVCRKCDEHID